jgi:hypothetical protein
MPWYYSSIEWWALFFEMLNVGLQGLKYNLTQQRQVYYLFISFFLLMVDMFQKHISILSCVCYI